MRIAIIETGAPPDQLNGKHPTYPKMMERILSPLAPHLSFTTYPTFRDGSLPKASEFDGMLITGSAAGVYEDHAWIAPLEELIRDAAAAGKPQVGICFGHQLMAQAFGGEVKKSDKGWGVGVHHYDVTGEAPWMTPASRQDRLRRLASRPGDGAAAGRADARGLRLLRIWRARLCARPRDLVPDASGVRARLRGRSHRDTQEPLRRIAVG